MNFKQALPAGFSSLYSSVVAMATSRHANQTLGHEGRNTFAIWQGQHTSRILIVLPLNSPKSLPPHKTFPHLPAPRDTRSKHGSKEGKTWKTLLFDLLGRRRGSRKNLNRVLGSLTSFPGEKIEPRFSSGAWSTIVFFLPSGSHCAASRAGGRSCLEKNHPDDLVSISCSEVAVTTSLSPLGCNEVCNWFLRAPDISFSGVSCLSKSSFFPQRENTGMVSLASWARREKGRCTYPISTVSRGGMLLTSGRIHWKYHFFRLMVFAWTFSWIHTVG